MVWYLIYQNQKNMEIAKTILSQLGGNKFVVMTGVKNLVSDGNALAMHLPRNKSKAKYLRIELNEMDTYTMTFQGENKKTFEFPIIAKHERVYFDMMRDIFTEVTGLYTSLGTCKA